MYLSFIEEKSMSKIVDALDEFQHAIESNAAEIIKGINLARSATGVIKTVKDDASLEACLTVPLDDDRHGVVSDAFREQKGARNTSPSSRGQASPSTARKNILGKSSLSGPSERLPSGGNRPVDNSKRASSLSPRTSRAHQGDALWKCVY